VEISTASMHIDNISLEICQLKNFENRSIYIRFAEVLTKSRASLCFDTQCMGLLTAYKAGFRRVQTVQANRTPQILGHHVLNSKTSLNRAENETERK